jgi:hypothetical protein
MKKLLILLFALIASTAFAAIFVNQEKDGSVEYTDTPSANSSLAEVPPVNTVGPQSPAKSEEAPPLTGNVSTVVSGPAGDVAAVSAPGSYKIFEIKSPANESTIQNQPTIPVEFKIEPNMLPGDKIQMYLDGKPAGTPAGTPYQELGIVERGTHTISASIINGQGQVIKTASQITIYVHRNSSITSPAMQAPNPR